MEGIIALIPARGGSKGVPRKNIKPLAGKPLIAYTIEEAKKSQYISRILVSTEDAEIKEIALKFGAEVIDRPDELAQDRTPALPVLQHAVRTLQEQGENVKLLVLLQATALFKKAEEIDSCIKVMLDGDYTGLISLSPTPKHFVKNWQKEIKDGVVFNHHDGLPINDDKKATRRQDLPTTYWKNGQIYIMKPETLLEEDGLFGSKCFGFVIDRNDLVNIDCPEDFAYAEYLQEQKLHRK